MSFDHLPKILNFNILNITWTILEISPYISKFHFLGLVGSSCHPRLSFCVFFPYNWDTVSLVGFLKRRKVLGIYIDIEKAWEAKTSNIRRCCICYRKFLRAPRSLARQAHDGVKWFLNPISPRGGILFIGWRTSQPWTFQPWTFQSPDFSTMNFWTVGLKSSWLKSPGLKLGIEKSGVEMSFNPWYMLVNIYFLRNKLSGS